MDLKVRNFKYKDEVIIEDVLFKVKSNKVNYLIGENGSGKSTLIQIFLGLIQGENIHRDYQLRNDYVYFMQAIPMLDLSCKKNIQLILGILFNKFNISLTDIENRVDKYIFNFFEKNWEKKYSDLSGGEARLLQLFCYLQTEKKLVVLDEPSANIDRLNVTYILNYIQNQNKTFLITTHDYRDLLATENYSVTCIEDGKVSFFGDKNEFESIETFESDFLNQFTNR
ncbi:ATP-binding cassette domain-containing protein [Facklamia sp. DSM 111018]|uniref:ATP-binding cassette domain-containing protein n=1 Tax=Facklamia lactis TaxID=2749967 RepID=A0ABS0LPY5_9LACT|nr:ATP-binding cassette domain-containing protein [Facklamia lactis]MBG9986211.1 ATP-binding cassette domain-containing protein [Facklamia lactis]